MKESYCKSKIPTIALILVLAISTLIVALPGANAQEMYVRIRGPSLGIVGEVAMIRLEVRDASGTVPYPWEDAMMGIKRPGSTDFVYVGPYGTDITGRTEHPFLLNQTGIYEFMWMVPPQGPLLPNPSTTNGEWYSEVLPVKTVTELWAQSYPYIGAIPNPVGVNQEVLLHIGISQQLARVDLGWENLTVTVTDPDGTETTLGPYKTDATGGTGDIFVPTKVGTYTLQTHFPEQIVPMSVGAYAAGTVMRAGNSEELELEVQDEPVTYYPGHPLPSEYWTRPIDSQLREWYTIAGSQLERDSNRFYPGNDGPEAPHVLWTEPITIGGLAGGEVTELHSFQAGDAYEGKWPGALTLGGLLYWRAGGSRGLEKVVTHCVDIRTGEELWSKIFLDNQSISFGQLLFWDSFNYHGVFPYLWITRGTTWHAFDAWSGDWRFTIENVPPGQRLVGPNGGIYILDVDTMNKEMSLWSMDGWIHTLVGSSAGSWGNNMEGRTHDASSEAWADSWLWTVPITSDLPGSIAAAALGDRVVGMGTTFDSVETWGLSLKEGEEGTLLFRESWPIPEGNLTLRAPSCSSLESGVMTIRAKEIRAFYGFSTETGKYLWGPTESRPYLDLFMGGPSGESGIIAYDKLYLGTMAGELHCYDVKTGKFLWKYVMTDPLSEILWSNNWPIEFGLVTDGKIYLFHTEHSVIDPKPRGAPFVCLDAITGDVIFRANGLIRATVWGGDPVIGDSVIVQMDTYDQRMYAFGKGPSEITVEAPLTGISSGSVATIRGTMMDVSPGTEDTSLRLRFPKGVPAVADESVGEWMNYVYHQFERPADVVGVTVKLEAVDPGNEYHDLGTTTSDSYGNYGFEFKPEVEGKWMIIVTFQGSNSYYPSTATTYMTVGPAPTPEQPITPEEPEPEAPWLTTEIAIIIAVVAVAVIAAVGYWVLRKRK